MASRARRGFVAMILGVCALTPSWLGWCPMLEAQELKVGYVSVGKVFSGYERTKTSEAALEKAGKQKDDELRSRVEELKKMREGLELLNDQAREAKAREVEQKADDLQRFRTATARDLSRERDKVAKSIFKDIRQAIEEYAKANSFVFILKQEDVMLYGQSAYDVTNEILKLLNGRYSAKKP